MIARAARRLLSIVATLLLVATLAFALVRLAPGGPFDQDRAIPVEIERRLAASYHLDQPVYAQYAAWLSALVLHGDLGPTFRYPNRSVNEIVALSLPVSLELGALALVFGVGLGVPLGVVGAARRGTRADAAATAAALLGVSVPRFVLAPLLIYALALRAHLFPVARWEGARHMVLPVICAGLPTAAYVARLTRAGVAEVLTADFVRTARAKGLSERGVLYRHALRAGLLPVVSYLGPGAAGLLVGSVVIERIFDVPGMGRYFVEAATNRDYNLLVGVVLVYGGLVTLLNALADLAYAWLDPRVGPSSSSGAADGRAALRPGPRAS